MPDDPPSSPDLDPLFGNRISGLLECALAGSDAGSSNAMTEHWEPPTPEHIAVLLPQYQIEHLIGRGGMGAVYKGRQITLNRPVAIKILPAELARNTDFVARFHREAQLLASLSHQNIVTIFDFGQTSEGHLYFVMEYVNGTDMHRLIHKSPVKLQPAQALNLTIQICEAMQYAHEMGVVHRDIKPANVLVTRDGRAKLADFGLAMKPADAASPSSQAPLPQGFETGSPDVAALRFTQPGQILGTPPYAAPEVYRGLADERSDIFALGIMFYEMLTGQVPEPRYQLPSERVSVDHRVDDVVIKALEAEPEARFQKASEMKQAVERATRPLSKAPPIPPGRTTPLAVTSVPSRVMSAAVPRQPRVAPPGTRSQPQAHPSAGRSSFLRILGMAVLTAAVLVGLDLMRDRIGMPRWFSKTTIERGGLSSTQMDESKQYIARAEHIMSTLKDSGQRAEMQSKIAVARARIGDVEGAMQAARTIAVVPRQHEAFAAVSGALGRIGRTREAITSAMLISDSDLREQTLALLAEVELTSGTTQHLAEIAGCIVTPAGKAALQGTTARALLRAGDRSGALALVASARELLAKGSEGKGGTQAQWRLVDVLARAGEFQQANVIALAMNGDPRDDPRRHVAEIQALQGDFKAAFATAMILPSRRARSDTLVEIAFLQTKKGLHTDAAETLKRVPYDFVGAMGRLRLRTLARDVPGAKAALEAIRQDTRNPEQVEGLYRGCLPSVAALIFEVEGPDAASRWIQALSEVRPQAFSWLALACARLPKPEMEGEAPRTPLSAIRVFAGLSSTAGSDASKPSAGKDEEAGYTALFDEDQKPFWAHSGDGSFKDEEGTYSSSSPQGDTWGIMWYSRRQYKDFTCRFELKVDSAQTNSGVYLRLPELGFTRPPLYFTTCYEMEVLGELTGIVPHYKPYPDNPPGLKIGEWNQVEISVLGQYYTFKVNGKIVSAFFGDRGTVGFIGIQNKSAKGSAHFRNLRVKQLSALAK